MIHRVAVSLTQCVQKVMSIHKLFNSPFFFFFPAWATACYVLEINADTGFLDNVCLKASVQKSIFDNVAENKTD